MEQHEYSTATVSERAISLTPILRTAALAVFALVFAVLWSMQPERVAEAPAQGAAVRAPQSSLAAAATVQGADTSAAVPADLSDFGPQVVGLLASQYAQLQAQNAYTPENGAAAAQQLVPLVQAPVSYRTYTIADLSIDADTSFARMQRYQADLRAALAPLSTNTTPEIGLFSQYVQTGDTSYLQQLLAVAQAYQDSATAGAKISVPKDALAVHLGALNAMSQFGAVLAALGNNSKDPITTMALLQSYNDAEQNMVNSFDALASYVNDHTRS